MQVEPTKNSPSTLSASLSAECAIHESKRALPQYDFVMSDGPPVHRVELWTSAEVARAFRVGVSSIKRWTDEGELESVRTPGGHRRYSLPDRKSTRLNS